MEGELQNAFSNWEIDFTSVPVADSAEATQKFRDGECDAMALGSLSLAEEKANQLNNDETWSDAPSEGIWVTPIYAGTSDSPGIIGNSVSIAIQQTSDEMISGLLYLHLQVQRSRLPRLYLCNSLPSKKNSLFLFLASASAFASPPLCAWPPPVGQQLASQQPADSS